MKFELVDSILELSRGQRIVATKAVTLSEEYLADHFPTFPVLPGVLMLQALVESAAWLVRDALDFSPTVILLKRARNVTYKSFVQPGQLLRLEVGCRRLAQDESDFEGTGFCNQTEAVRARFSLIHFRLDDRLASMSTVDGFIADGMRAAFARLRRVSSVEAVTAPAGK